MCTLWAELPRALGLCGKGMRAGTAPGCGWDAGGGLQGGVGAVCPAARARCPRRQQDLFRVLKAYTLYRPEEGYCQAQAPIAAVLLMHMPAEVWPRALGAQLAPPGGSGALWGVLMSGVPGSGQPKVPQGHSADFYPLLWSLGAGTGGCRDGLWVLTCCPLACSKRSGAWCRSVRSTSLATTARNW